MLSIRLHKLSQSFLVHLTSLLVLRFKLALLFSKFKSAFNIVKMYRVSAKIVSYKCFDGLFVT